jgi:hypothetical protein
VIPEEGHLLLKHSKPKDRWRLSISTKTHHSDSLYKGLVSVSYAPEVSTMDTSESISSELISSFKLPAE